MIEGLSFFAGSDWLRGASCALHCQMEPPAILPQERRGNQFKKLSFALKRFWVSS